METSNECLSRYRVRSPRILAVALLSLLLNSGCGREFYREWANQDVSEAVFEKSRDPRWRLDLFTIEPPAMSRFADPYDPDRPPAPPDDYPTQAMSPVPQWPDNRLLLPIEGTGYLDMLSAWQRERPDPPKKPEKPKDEDLAPGKGESYERKRKEPLRGGTTTGSGGGLFGNPGDFKR